MKKKKIIILFLLVSIIFSCNICYAAGPSTFFYKNKTDGILAYNQVNAFLLKLSDGTTLSSMSLSSTSNIDLEKNMKDVEIVFVLDNSGSMKRDDRIEHLKTAVRDLTNKLFEKIGSEHLKIGLIRFSSGILGTPQSLTNNANDIYSINDSMKADGGTHMSKALEAAYTMLTESTNTEALKIVVTLSDGKLSDESTSLKELEKINSSGISTISIFVEHAIGKNFEEFATTNTLHKNFETTTSGMADTIVNDLYKQIYMLIILMYDPTTSYNLNNAGIIPGDDKIILQLDAELLHGATLYIEYVINIISAFDSKNIIINDIPGSSLVYSPNQYLLTENKTNADYGWNYTNNILYCTSGSQTIPAIKEYTKKLVLTSVLTPETLNRSSTFNNCMVFSLDKILNDGTTTTITATEAQDGGRIRALNFLIIPPTGLDLTHIIIINVSVITFFTCIFVLLYTLNKVRLNNKKTRH